MKKSELKAIIRECIEEVDDIEEAKKYNTQPPRTGLKPKPDDVHAVRKNSVDGAITNVKRKALTAKELFNTKYKDTSVPGEVGKQFRDRRADEGVVQGIKNTYHKINVKRNHNAAEKEYKKRNAGEFKDYKEFNDSVNREIGKAHKMTRHRNAIKKEAIDPKTNADWWRKNDPNNPVNVERKEMKDRALRKAKRQEKKRLSNDSKPVKEAMIPKKSVDVFTNKAGNKEYDKRTYLDNLADNKRRLGASRTKVVKDTSGKKVKVKPRWGRQK